MFLRQNFIFCRLRLWGLGSGVLSGVAAVLLTICEFWAVKMVIFWGRENFSEKSKDFKKMWCYTIFSHFFMGWFCEIFGGYEPIKGLQRLYIMLFSVIFWSRRALARFQACFLRVIRLRLPFCGWWWGGGADSVKLREGRLYMYISVSVFCVICWFF